MWEESLVPGDMYKNYALSPADQQRLAAVQAPNDSALRSYVAGTSPGEHPGRRLSPLSRSMPAPATPAAHTWASGGPARLRQEQEQHGIRRQDAQLACLCNAHRAQPERVHTLTYAYA